MLRQYSGFIGTFEYDDTLWRIKHEKVDLQSHIVMDHLQWIGSNKLCDLPKGITRCTALFKDTTLSIGFEFGEFDTSKVVDMSWMFANVDCTCSLYLPNDFDTSNVQSMDSMFNGAYVEGRLYFSDSFKTADVQYLRQMFKDCTLKDGAEINRHFILEGDCENIFENCYIHNSDVSNSDPKEVVDDWIGYLEKGDTLESITSNAVNWLRSSRQELLNFKRQISSNGWFLSQDTKKAVSWLVDIANEIAKSDIVVDSLEEQVVHRLVNSVDMLVDAGCELRKWYTTEAAKDIIGYLGSAPQSLYKASKREGCSAHESYDFSRILDVPSSTLKNLMSRKEFDSLVDKCCKL